MTSKKKRAFHFGGASGLLLCAMADGALAQDAVVGGDLYDCYHAEEYVRFLVGDVRGKGIAAVEQASKGG